MPNNIDEIGIEAVPSGGDLETKGEVGLAVLDGQSIAGEITLCNDVKAHT
jgi:hypothetical protein